MSTVFAVLHTVYPRSCVTLRAGLHSRLNMRETKSAEGPIRQDTDPKRCAAPGRCLLTVSNRPKTGHVVAYTPAEVQALLKIGRDHVYALLRSGALQNVKAGRRYIIPAEALAAFLRGQK